MDGQMTVTGGKLLVDCLLANGVDRAYGVPGESYLAVLDALHDAPIALTISRQEGGAAMMADADARLTGRPGIHDHHVGLPHQFGERCRDTLQVDADPGKLRGQMRRDSRRKTIRIDLPLAGQHIAGSKQLFDVFMLFIVIAAGRHRFHADHALALRGKSMQQRTADQRFADPGIRACDKVTHFSLNEVWTMAAPSIVVRSCGFQAWPYTTS